MCLAGLAAVLLGACTSPTAAPEPASDPSFAAASPVPDAGPEAGSAPRPSDVEDAPIATVDGPADATARPDWLGTRVLPLAPDGFGVRLPTPPELVDRRLATPTPPLEATAVAADRTLPVVLPVPATVLARSTWHAGCPVDADELRYVVVLHVGFDSRDHVGELLVHASVAEAVAEVFGQLHAARFPLEELRVIAPEDLAAPPTGDGNVTSAFVCRTTITSTEWSAHASGLAVDINPFHNPYVRGDLILPELAGTYVDRDDVRPGMVVAGDVVTGAFAAAGWEWGGDWSGPASDPMHFSATGR